MRIIKLFVLALLPQLTLAWALVAPGYLYPKQHAEHVSPETEIIVRLNNEEPVTPGKACIMPNGVSVPGDFPHISVTTHKETAGGYLFVHCIREIKPYNIIFSNDGSPVWYERWGDGELYCDFTVQRNGIITMTTSKNGGRYVGYDQNFNEIGTFKPAAGYSHDGHELQVLKSGNYLIIGRRDVQVDMSKIIDGGQKNARIQESAVQEFTPNHQMIFNWSALANLSDGLPYLELDDPRGKTFRFPHINAIDVDKDDGHLLISCRMLSEITKVDRETGDIIWRLGGAHSDFVFVNDPLHGFSSQHDIRSLGDGRYSVFDNGNFHVPPQSRGAVYELDMQNKTARLVWEYRMPPENGFSYYMGSLRQLDNGNYLINWAVGALPKATEVTPAGEVVYEMNFSNRYDTYRTFRQPWNGRVAKPRLIIEQEDKNIVLLFNKFGDPNVAYYKIYGDTLPRPTTVLDTARATLKKLSNLTNRKRYFFRVTAVDSNGSESIFSDEKNVFVYIVELGENIITNGDFSVGQDGWTFNTVDADAAADVTPDEVMQIRIDDAGENFDSIQLKQLHIPLVFGTTYRLEFDARAVADRVIEAHIEQAGYPWNNYAKLNPTPLRRAEQHFVYEFIMADPSDAEAQLVFNCGVMSDDVFIDNVALSIIDDNSPLQELPPPWQHQDIGETPLAGDAGMLDDQIVVRGSGGDIAGTNDQFHFAYQKIAGDVEISARVNSIGNTDAWAKGGVMIRDTLEPGSAYMMMGSTVSMGMIYQRRTFENKVSVNRNFAELALPRWVKVVRTGDRLSSYESLDGDAWNIVGTEEIDLNKAVFIGCVATSYNENRVCSVYFDDVRIVSTTAIADQHYSSAPATFALYPAFPNPFNPSTTIAYKLPERAQVHLIVYNLRGELVRELVHARQNAGEYKVEFDASKLSSGLYFYELTARSSLGESMFHAVNKMTVVK